MQEENKNRKEKWGKPKLIVITRGDRQESVLAACKSTVTANATDWTFAKCVDFDGVETCPGNCFAVSPS